MIALKLMLRIVGWQAQCSGVIICMYSKVPGAK